MGSSILYRTSWLGFRCEILGFESDFLRFDNFCEDFEDSGKNRKFQKNREKISFKFLDLLINLIMSENVISGTSWLGFRCEILGFEGDF